jgi:hypothetical protein
MGSGRTPNGRLVTTRIAPPPDRWMTEALPAGPTACAPWGFDPEPSLASATSAVQPVATAACAAVLHMAGHGDHRLGETKRVHTARGFHMFVTRSSSDTSRSPSPTRPGGPAPDIGMIYLDRYGFRVPTGGGRTDPRGWSHITLGLDDRARSHRLSALDLAGVVGNRSRAGEDPLRERRRP